MADALDTGEGLSIEGETVDLNQLKGLFTEWLDSDVQDGIYRCVGFRSVIENTGRAGRYQFISTSRDYICEVLILNIAILNLLPTSMEGHTSSPLVFASDRCWFATRLVFCIGSPAMCGCPDHQLGEGCVVRLGVSGVWRLSTRNQMTQRPHFFKELHPRQGVIFEIAHAV